MAPPDYPPHPLRLKIFALDHWGRDFFRQRTKISRGVKFGAQEKRKQELARGSARERRARANGPEAVNWPERT